MFYKKTNTVWLLLLVFFELRCHNAQKVNSTDGNQDPGLSSVDTRFFDVNGPGYGYPNSQPGRFGNTPSNYLGNSSPYGNQNGNMQQPGYGWTPNSRNPNQGYNQGRPGQQSGNYPGNYPYQQNPNNYNGGYNPGYNNMNQYPNYQRPYSNGPGNGVYPGNGSPYQNGGMPYNQGGYPNQPDTRYPQNGQYSPQGNYQGNPNYGAGGYRPGYPNNFNNDPNSNIQFPENDMQPQNQYPPQNGVMNQGNMNVRPNQNNYPSYPPADLHTHVQFPGNNPNNNVGNEQFPNQDMNQGNSNNVAGPNQVPGSYNGPQSGLQNNQHIDSINGPNANDSAVPGSPMFVPSSTTSPGQLVFDGSTVSPTQCKQNCETTSEYSPVCGTNNVTYSNPARFYCARNCGVAVNLRQMGRCTGEPAANNSQQ